MALFSPYPTLPSPAERSTYHSLRLLLAEAGIPVSLTGLAEELLYHPAFPEPGSLLAALETWQVPHLVVQLAPAHLPEIEGPALAWLQEPGAPAARPVCLLAVTETEVRFAEGPGRAQRLSLAAFADRWTGLTVLVEADAQAGEPGYAQHRAAERRAARTAWIQRAGLVLLASLLLISILGQPASLAGPLLAWGLLKLGGLAVAVALLRASLGQGSRWCYREGRDTCRDLLQTAVGRLGGWGSLSEVVAWYQAAGLLLWALGLVTGTAEAVLFWLSLGSLLALPAAGASLALQAWRYRQWCRLCLATAGLIGLESLLAGWTLPIQAGAPASWPLVGLAVLLPGLVWPWVKPHWGQRAARLAAEAMLRVYRALPAVFEAVLAQGRPVAVTPLPLDLVAGAPDAPVQVTLYLDPLCGACREHFEAAEVLRAQAGGAVALRLRFYAPAGGGAGTPVAQRVMGLAQEAGMAAAWAALRDWFGHYAPDAGGVKRWQARYGVADATAPELAEQLAATRDWAEAEDLPGIPYVIVNGQLVQADEAFFRDLARYARQQVGMAVG